MKYVLAFAAGVVLTALGVIGFAIMDKDLIIVEDTYEA